MPGGLSMLKQLYTYMLGGTNPPGAASASGDVGQMVKWLTANVLTAAGMPYNDPFGMPGRRTTPIDVTISGSTTLTERVNFFKNLTINASQTLTGLAGGTFVIVEETLTIGASGALSANALGAKGGAGQASGSVGKGGQGGGPRGYMAALTRSYDYAQWGTYATSNPPIDAGPLWGSMANGGGEGVAGSAWPYVTSMANPFQAGWELIAQLIALINMRNADDATYGGLGGGGGAGGQGGATASGSGGTAGTIGGVGGDSSTDSHGAAGGSGFGGGGGCPNRQGMGNNGTGGDGGRGGGVLIVLAKVINNAGVISADGAAGANSADAVGGGGGGGGAVIVGYEATSGSGVGTVRANGGSGGTGKTGLDAGSAGGAGMAYSFKIRSGS